MWIINQPQLPGVASMMPTRWFPTHWVVVWAIAFAWVGVVWAIPVVAGGILTDAAWALLDSSIFVVLGLAFLVVPGLASLRSRRNARRLAQQGAVFVMARVRLPSSRRWMLAVCTSVDGVLVMRCENGEMIEVDVLASSLDVERGCVTVESRGRDVVQLIPTDRLGVVPRRDVAHVEALSRLLRRSGMP